MLRITPSIAAALGIACTFVLASAPVTAVADPATDWEFVGNNPIQIADGAVAHDLVSHDTRLIVAYIADSQGTRTARATEFMGALDWVELSPSPSQGASSINDAVALAFAGSTPCVVYSSTSTAHLMERVGSSWSELGAPGYSSACYVHMSLSLAFDGATPHLISYGVGGCGIGIDYGYWDGVAWQSHASPTPFPGQITMSGNGRPDLVIADRAYVGVPESVWPTTVISVVYWDSPASSWADLVGPIQENSTSGSNEHMSLATDGAGHIYAAWSEEIAAGGKAVYVKRFNPLQQSWTLLGGGKASGAGDATFPSIAVIEGAPWLAYLEKTAGVDAACVRRFDEGGGAWQMMGSPLNEDTTASAFSPVIGAIGGVPHVAFREGAGSPHDLYVKRYPSTTAVTEGTPPREYALHPNVPNPFNPATAIRYDVPPGGGTVTLRIYDVSGRLVRTLVDGVPSTGRNAVTWRGRDERGRQVATGVYFYRMTAPGFDETRKMVLMK